MADEALHDIQLNGKQLVFLFMSATIVAVVIFLCGVMVGRGVRAPLQSELTQTAAESDADPTAPAQAPVATGSSVSSSGGPATTPQETLSYTDRLEAPDTPEETLQEPAPVGSASRPARSAAVPAPLAPPVRPAISSAPSAETGAEASAKTAAPSSPGAAPRTVAAAAGAAAGPATGSGFVVQVAATRERDEADTLVRRLTGKGYPAFVTTPANGPHLFRVRVGAYPDRREAESVATRLEKEEQFKPWITR